MKKTLITFSFLCLFTSAKGQVSIPLGVYDLGKIHPVKVAPNQDLTIILEELIPVLTNYEVTFSSKTEEIEHLNNVIALNNSDCGGFVGKLKNAQSEKDVRQLLRDWPASCSNPLLNETKKSFFSSDLRTLSPFGRASLRYGETLVVFVKRLESPDKKIPEASWTFELSPGSQGKWQFSYGANFFNLMSRDEEYYMDANKRIQKVEKDYWNTIVKPMPSVCLTFFPTHKLANKYFVAFSAGYATNLQSNNVFAGMSVVVRQNVLIHANVGVRQVNRLRGKYINDFKSKNIFPTTIDAEDLIEPNFIPDISIGISFRFKDNPFGTNNNVQ